MNDYIFTRINPHQVQVWNEVTDAHYRLDLADKGWYCNCPHFHYRLRRPPAKCKHIEEFERRGCWDE